MTNVASRLPDAETEPLLQNDSSRTDPNVAEPQAPVRVADELRRTRLTSKDRFDLVSAGDLDPEC